MATVRERALLRAEIEVDRLTGTLDWALRYPVEASREGLEIPALEAAIEQAYEKLDSIVLGTLDRPWRCPCPVQCDNPRFH